MRDDILMFLGLMAAVGFGAMGWWCLTLDGHQRAIRRRLETLRQRQLAMRQQFRGMRLTDAQAEELRQMDAEIAEQAVGRMVDR